MNRTSGCSWCLILPLDEAPEHQTPQPITKLSFITAIWSVTKESFFAWIFNGDVCSTSSVLESLPYFRMIRLGKGSFLEMFHILSI